MGSSITLINVYIQLLCIQRETRKYSAFTGKTLNQRHIPMLSWKASSLTMLTMCANFYISTPNTQVYLVSVYVSPCLKHSETQRQSLTTPVWCLNHVPCSINAQKTFYTSSYSWWSLFSGALQSMNHIELPGQPRYWIT